MLKTQQDKALFDRLFRIESRMIRGFTDLGARVEDDADWITIDVERKQVSIKGASRSIAAIRLAISKTEGYTLGNYNVMVGDELVATVRM